MIIKLATSIQQTAAAAFTQAWDNLLAQFNGSWPNFAIIFTNAPKSFQHQELLPAIKKTTPDLSFIGSSTPNIDSSQDPSPTIALIGFQSSNLKLQTSIGQPISTKPEQSGQEFSKKLTNLTSPNLTFAFADFHSPNTQQTFKAIHDQTKSSLYAFSTTSNQFTETIQLFNHQILSDSILGLNLSQDIQFATQTTSTWVSSGIKAKITQSENSKITQINETPIVNFFQNIFSPQYLSQESNHITTNFANYPLSFKNNENSQLSIPIKIESDGIIFNNSIPINTEIEIMITKPDSIIQSIKSSLLSLKQQLANQTPQFLFCTHSYAHYRELQAYQPTISQIIQEIFNAEIPFLQILSFDNAITNQSNQYISATNETTFLAIK